MRILIVHNAYAQRGGEDAVVEQESEALRARGHDVHLLIRDSAVLHAAPMRGVAETLLTIHNPHAARELSHVLQSVQPDVVHLHNLFPRWGLAALRTLARHGVPVVQTIHNFRWLCAPATLLLNGKDCRRCVHGNFASAVRYACMKNSRAVSASYAMALASNRASGLAERTIARFVCVSDFVRDAHVQAGFDAQKLVVKGHFVPGQHRADLAGDGTVLFAGRFSAEKGLDVLLRAMRLLPNVVLNVVGDGPERAQLEAGLGDLRSRARFLGRLTREQLFRELERTSVCVVPSIGSETFGLAALEAFACGRPVVATDAGGLPELVHNGENGWVVARGDARALADRVQWLLTHREQAQAFGRAGRALVERAYLPDANMKQLEAIYADAVAGG